MTPTEPPRRSARRRNVRGPGRPRVQALTEDHIHDAALALIDAEGLAAFSMRRLAADLGVDPMSIYHHVGSRDALLSGVVARVLRQHAPKGRPEAPWRDRVHAWAQQYRALAMAHPNLVLPLVEDTAAASRLAPPTLEPLYAALSAHGMDAQEIVDVADTLVDYVHGFVIAESAQVDVPAFDRGRMLDDLDDDALPHVARVLGSMRPDELQYDFDEGFERGINVLLVGISGYRRA